jgi:hypothetical protein
MSDKQATPQPKKTQTAMEMFDTLRSKFMEQVPEENQAAYKRFGEKFHSSFNVNTGSPVDLSTINMEESLAYVVESLKSGLHPRYLSEDEVVMLRAGYGDKWYEKWEYTEKDLQK